jgi:hypothetical protein
VPDAVPDGVALSSIGDMTYLEPQCFVPRNPFSSHTLSKTCSRPLFVKTFELMTMASL